ncbi:BTAD domain-containing putative transcriptional regulator [Nonomuraea sp. NPDC049480]|uniref:AfsR/SARP family transcriptional regulator n=1 Tax=Nonomuraea sp. NPDC049480 TaxID=3364353 RepID=UPI00378B5F7A
MRTSVSAGQTYLETELALGQHAALIPQARALTRAQPCNEGATAVLMRACGRAGQPHEAVAAYDRLAEEIGVHPGNELTRLYRQIRDRDLALDIPPPPPTGALMTSHSTAPDEPTAGTSPGSPAADNVCAFPQVTPSHPDTDTEQVPDGAARPSPAGPDPQQIGTQWIFHGESPKVTYHHAERDMHIYNADIDT